MRKVIFPTSFVLVLAASLITAAGLSVTHAACVKDVAADDVLNIRSGPGSRYKIVGHIGPYECGVLVQRYEGRWAYVDRGGGGFVHGRFLRREDREDDGRNENQYELKCVRGVASNDVLNVRRRPTISSKITGSILPIGCFIEVLRRQGQWVKVRYSGGVGWVKRQYLTR